MLTSRFKLKVWHEISDVQMIFDVRRPRTADDGVNNTSKM